MHWKRATFGPCLLLLVACGSSSAVPAGVVEDGSTADGCAAGEVSCTGSVLDGGACPDDASSACTGCRGHLFCVAGPCPLVSCPASDAGVADTGDDESQDGGHDGSHDDGSAAADTADADADAGADAGAAADGAVCPPAPPVPAPIPSTGSVSFVITNTSTADRYVVTQASGCDPFSISGQTLSLPFSCPCECDAPRPSFDVELLPSGTSTTILWDGRSLVSYTAYQDCTAYGAPGRCGSSVMGAPRPVGAGTLTVTVDYLTQAPPSLGVTTTCNAAPGGFACQGMPNFNGGRCGQQDLPGAQQATATFDLPASGGMVVPVAIP